MRVEELDTLLRESSRHGFVTLADRNAIVSWLSRNAATDEARRTARRRLFAIAKEQFDRDELIWVEAVSQLFDEAPLAQMHGQAFFSPGKTCIHEVLNQFDRAQRSADVCVFTITDDRITDAIIRAHARGVQVRIITDDEKAHDQGSDIDQLQMVGIACKMDVRNPAHMHHKFALFDSERLMNGSFNWTRSASEQNEENLIVTTDPALVAAFAERFEMLWTKLRFTDA